MGSIERGCGGGTSAAEAEHIFAIHGTTEEAAEKRSLSTSGAEALIENRALSQR
jgi:hypothetical protein